EPADMRLWELVNGWYKHPAEFTIESELPNLRKQEQHSIFPLLEPVIEGKLPVSHYQDEDMIIIGTPEMCLEKIMRYEEAGVDHLLCYVQFGDIAHDQVMRCLELLGTKVIPELEARGHRVDSAVNV